MIEGRDDDETARLTAEALRVTEDEARMIIAIERGEIDGDLIVIDEDGNPIRINGFPDIFEPPAS
jgi:hypothetical protein